MGISTAARADQAKTATTPTVKTMKHKGTHSHKKKRKGSMKSNSTPTVKK
jgi:hypothetical protein